MDANKITSSTHPVVMRFQTKLIKPAEAPAIEFAAGTSLVICKAAPPTESISSLSSFTFDPTTNNFNISPVTNVAMIPFGNVSPKGHVFKKHANILELGTAGKESVKSLTSAAIKKKKLSIITKRRQGS